MNNDNKTEKYQYIDKETHNYKYVDYEDLGWFDSWMSDNPNLYFFTTFLPILPICFFLCRSVESFPGYGSFYPLIYNLTGSPKELLISFSGGVNSSHLIIFFILSFVLFLFFLYTGKFNVNRRPSVWDWVSDLYYQKRWKYSYSYVEPDYIDYCNRVMAERRDEDIASSVLRKIYYLLISVLKYILTLFLLSRLIMLSLYYMGNSTVADFHTCKVVIADKEIRFSDAKGSIGSVKTYIDGIQYWIYINKEGIFDNIKEGDSISVTYKMGRMGFPIIDEKRLYTTLGSRYMKKKKPEELNFFEKKDIRDSLFNVLDSNLYQTKELVRKAIGTTRYKGYNNRPATSRVLFKVVPDGRVKGDVQQEQSLRSDIDDAMIRAVRSMKHWEPVTTLRIQNPVSVSLWVDFKDDGKPEIVGYSMREIGTTRCFRVSMDMSYELTENGGAQNILKTAKDSPIVEYAISEYAKGN